MPPEIDLEEDWAELREPPTTTIEIARNDLPGLMAMAMAKTQHDLRAFIEKDQTPITPDSMSALVAKGVHMFWGHLTTGAKGLDTAGLIEVILSTQGLSSAELKAFVRALPRSLLDRIVQSKLGAQAGGLHALLALEVLVRDNRENDYTVSAVSTGGLEVTVRARSHNNQQVTFRLDETFSPSTSLPDVGSNCAETPNATDR